MSCQTVVRSYAQVIGKNGQNGQNTQTNWIGRIMAMDPNKGNEHENAITEVAAATGLAYLLDIALKRVHRPSKSSMEYQCCILASEAAQYGHINCLEVLRRRKYKITDASSEAALYGQLDVLKWTKTHNCLKYKEDFTYFVRTNQLNTVMYALMYDASFGINICANAARGGHLEVLKWLLTNGFVWDAATCMCAAEGGHLDMLKWLRLDNHWNRNLNSNSNGPCPWNEWTCMMAAMNNHLETLKWLRSQTPRVHKPVTHVPWRQETDILAYSTGCVLKLPHAHYRQKYAQMPLAVDTWKY